MLKSYFNFRPVSVLTGALVAIALSFTTPFAHADSTRPVRPPKPPILPIPPVDVGDDNFGFPQVTDLADKGTIGLVCIDQAGRLIPWFADRKSASNPKGKRPFERCVRERVRADEARDAYKRHRHESVVHSRCTTGELGTLVQGLSAYGSSLEEWLRAN